MYLAESRSLVPLSEAQNQSLSSGRAVGGRPQSCATLSVSLRKSAASVGSSSTTSAASIICCALNCGVIQRLLSRVWTMWLPEVGRFALFRLSDDHIYMQKCQVT